MISQKLWTEGEWVVVAWDEEDGIQGAQQVSMPADRAWADGHAGYQNVYGDQGLTYEVMSLAQCQELGIE